MAPLLVPICLGFWFNRQRSYITCIILPPHIYLLTLTTTMRPRKPQQTLEKRVTRSISEIVRVGGLYRVGKLLGTGGSGEFNSDSNLGHFLSSLGSVYLGKDIMTGSDVALKIGHRSSRFSHEYNVYTTIAGSKGISQVRWYGKEAGYEVIVLDYLGTSLGDLIDQLELDHGKTFSYATQMVRLLYKTDDRTKYTLACSSR
jgi:serine/threonine protein kinase